MERTGHVKGTLHVLVARDGSTKGGCTFHVRCASFSHAHFMRSFAFAVAPVSDRVDGCLVMVLGSRLGMVVAVVTKGRFSRHCHTCCVRRCSFLRLCAAIVEHFRRVSVDSVATWARLSVVCSVPLSLGRWLLLMVVVVGCCSLSC